MRSQSVTVYEVFSTVHCAQWFHTLENAIVMVPAGISFMSLPRGLITLTTPAPLYFQYPVHFLCRKFLNLYFIYLLTFHLFLY